MGIITTITLVVEFMLFSILTMTIDPHSIELLITMTIEISTKFQLQLDLTTQGLFFAQQFQNVDILGNIQTGWNDFLQSGKAGTFAVGLVLGYIVRGITR